MIDRSWCSFFFIFSSLFSFLRVRFFSGHLYRTGAVPISSMISHFTRLGPRIYQIEKKSAYHMYYIILKL